MRTDGLDDDKEQFEVNPPTKFLTSRQRHVIIGLIGLCLVLLMSFPLLMLLNILKGSSSSHNYSPIDIIVIPITVGSGYFVVPLAPAQS